MIDLSVDGKTISLHVAEYGVARAELSVSAALALAERLREVAAGLVPCRECGGVGTVLQGTGYGRGGSEAEVPCPRCAV